MSGYLKSCFQEPSCFPAPWSKRKCLSSSLQWVFAEEGVTVNEVLFHGMCEKGKQVRELAFPEGLLRVGHWGEDSFLLPHLITVTIV